MSTAVQMVEGSLAAMGAAAASTPFEVVKTRLQLQGELQKRTATNTHYRGTLHGLVTIQRNEGFRALYKGFGCALAYQSVMNGIRLGCYEECKTFTGAVLPSGNANNLAAGVAVGFIGAIVSSPLFLVKTRQQAQSSHVAVGEQHQYKTFLHGLRDIAKEKGVAGLWQGSLLAAVRTAIGSGIQLASYDGIKPVAGRATGLERSDTRLHVLTSLLTSAVVAVGMNPFDVVMTRTYTSSKQEYSANFAASFAKIVKAEGVEGLFKGTGALWSRVAPHTICTFVLLEKLRSMRKNYFETHPAEGHE